MSSEGLSRAHSGHQKCSHCFTRDCWSRLPGMSLTEPGEPGPEPQLPTLKPVWGYHCCSPRWVLRSQGWLWRGLGEAVVLSHPGKRSRRVLVALAASLQHVLHESLAWMWQSEVSEQTRQQHSLLKTHQQDLDRRDLSHKFISPLPKLHLRAWDSRSPWVPFALFCNSPVQNGGSCRQCCSSSSAVVLPHRSVQSHRPNSCRCCPSSEATAQGDAVPSPHAAAGILSTSPGQPPCQAQLPPQGFLVGPTASLF